MDNRNVLFICIGGKKRGAGHIRRSARVVEALLKASEQSKNHNLRIEFAVLKDDGAKDIASKIIKRRFPVAIIQNSQNSLLQIIEKKKPSLVFIDMLDFDTRFIKQGKKDRKNLIIITLDNSMAGADIYINSREQNKIRGPGKAFYGYKYWLIEKPKVRKDMPNANEVRRVLISCGYTDPDNMTQKIAALISKSCQCNRKHDESGKKQEPRITCIVTSLYSKKQLERLKKMPYISIKKDLEDLTGEIIKSDICVTRGGNTMMESIALAVPTLVVSCGRENDELARALVKKGFLLKTRNNGWNEKEFHKVFKQISGLYRRKKLYKACLGFDGFGLEKAVKIIMSELSKLEIQG